MRACAPGKLVLSGAYAVLDGAPALVAAVDRYAVADASRRADFVSDEVREALRRRPLGAPPWIDASALRDAAGDRKLGLGSSAAILVASLACLWPEPDGELAASIFPLALASHRAAQGGGSGIDVAASCFGGVSVCRLSADGALSVAPHPLPTDLVIEVWSCPEAASTRSMLEAVGALAGREPGLHRRCLDAAGAAAADALAAADAVAFNAAVGAQWEALAALGDAAGAPIVTAAVRALDAAARDLGARFGPSGAGGGDVAFYAGGQPSPARFRARAEQAGLCLVEMRVGAHGVKLLA